MPFCLPMEIAELYQRFLASQGVFTDTRKQSGNCRETEIGAFNMFLPYMLLLHPPRIFCLVQGVAFKHALRIDICGQPIKH